MVGPLEQGDTSPKDRAIERLKQKLRMRRMEGEAPPLAAPTTEAPAQEDSPAKMDVGQAPTGPQPFDLKETPIDGKTAKPAHREGIADDPLEDAVNLANELVQGVFHLGKLGVQYVGDPAQWLKDMKLLSGKKAGNVGQVTGAMLDSFTENYKDDEGNVNIKDAITKRTFHTASDIAAVISIVGGLAKLSGRVAGGASRSGLTAEILQKLPQMSKADKVLRAGELIERVSRNIDPVTLSFRGSKAVAGKIAAKPMKALSDWTGVGEHTKPILAMDANEFASEMVAGAKDKLDLAYKHLSPEEAVAIRKAIRRGSNDDFAALTPNAKVWLERYSGKVEGPGGQEATLESRMVGLTPERKVNANAIAAAIEEFGPNPTKEQIAVAAGKVRSGEWKPVYASLLEPQGEQTLLDTLTADYQRSRRYGRLEGRTGQGVYEKDPFTVAFRQIDAFRHNNAKLRMMDRALRYLSDKKALVILKNLKELPEGYAVIETPILKRYFEVKNRAGAALVDELMRGKTGDEALRAAYAKVIGDETLRKPIGQAQHVAVPKHVARLIDLRLGAPSGLGIVYDRLLNYWRRLATLWRPSAWIGAAVGNAFMDLIHGIGPDDVIRSRKIKDFLPPEIAARIQTDVGPEGANVFERVSQTLGEYYSGLDDLMVRGPVFAKEAERVRRQSYQALKSLGADFFAAVDTIDDEVKWAQLLAVSPEKLSQAQRNLLLLQEQIAGQVPEMGKLDRDYQRVTAKIQKLEGQVAAQLDVVLGQAPSYRTKQLIERLRGLEGEAEAIRARVGPTMEAAKAARTTARRGPEAIKREIEETLRELKIDLPPERKAVLEQRIKELEAEQTALRQSDEALQAAGTEAKAALRKGRHGLTRQLAKALADEERAAVQHYVEILRSIRERGGIRLTQQTERFPIALLAKKGGGVALDELAQEFADVGLIDAATLDDLADFIDVARDAIITSREAVKNVLPRARVLAAGKVNDAIGELIANVRERAKIRQQLAQVARAKRRAPGEAQGAAIKAQAEPAAKENFRRALQELEAMSKSSVALKEKVRDFAQRIRETRRKLTAEDQRQIGKAAELRRELEEAIQAGSRLEGELKTGKANLLQKWMDAGRIKQTIPELEQVAKWADDAIEAGNRLAGNYSRLHPIERRFFRKLVPFWPYMKTMTKFVFMLPVLYPKKVFFWNHWARMVIDMAQDEEYTPERLRSSFPVAHTADGSTVFLKLSSFIPWAGVRTAEVGTIPILAPFDLAGSNPWIKAGYELSGGIPKWSMRPLSPGEDMTRMDNGEVWKLRPNGTVKKTIAQSSPWRSLWYLFPPSQLVESLFMNSVQTDRGWLLNPDPILYPNGEPMFPRDLLERASSFLGPTISKKYVPEEIRKEQAVEARTVRNFIGDIRRAPPEKREAMQETLRDWIEQRQNRRR